MDPWASGRLFPSARYGRRPRQELNALAVYTSAAFGFISLAAPPALSAFLPVAAASGVCLWTTPPYCANCQRVTRHARVGRTHLQTEGVGIAVTPQPRHRRNAVAGAGRRDSSAPAPATRHVFLSHYRCRDCGSEITRRLQCTR
jgi:ribosomal protein L44E